MKKFSDYLNEGDHPTYKLEIEVRDPDNELYNLIEKIRVHASPGHSFIVIVDPDRSQKEGGNEKFSMDGDGSFHIIKLKKEEL